jgi:nucleoid-associated protein YgaU
MARAILRRGARAFIGYLIAVTVLVTASRLLRVRGLTAFTQRVTPGVVRRLASGGGGLGLALGTLLGSVPAPGLASGPDPPTVVAASDRPPRSQSGVLDIDPAVDTATMTRLGDSPPETATMTREPPLARHAVPGDAAGPGPLLAAASEATNEHGPGPPQAPDDSTWIVEPGDSFWSIAEDVLTPRGGPARGDRQIGRYWRRLIDANRSRLVDPRNPDLLLPGQRLQLPRPDG